MRPDLDCASSPDTPEPDRQLAQRLRTLPDTLPPYGYGEFSRRRAQRRGRQAQAPLRLLAAALAVIVLGWGVRHGLEPAGGAGSTSDGLAPPAADQPSAAGATALALPVAASAERWLEAQPRSAIVRVPSQMAVTELEDQIASLDDQLTTVRLSQPRAAQLAALQRDRAQLVESLAQVRYAQILVAGVR